MEPAHLIAFNIALLAAIASPGPSLLFLTRSSMAFGRRAGVAAAAGLAVMAALWTLMALLGLQGLFTVFPWAYVLLKTLGAAYLLYIAWTMWRGADRALADSHAPSGRRMFLQGLLINLGNPKSVIFAAAVLLVIFPPQLSAGDKAVIFLNHLAVELAVQPLLAVLLSTGPVRRRYLAAKPVLDRIAAAVLGALGLRLLLQR
ncbi:LysE family translocator [Sedimentitalea sp. JM2-8]|uniref:LysE family translocator n=1 Tax=Sedimentitalea xiamensis TaxID=3050037 RepID=A0ABT7FBK0_9RHOB|nr:LysE family translocator [Sedimentitalea xiamensis]MDK3072482.1 LysE family translocator [Sedimentitalea xiamensis]